MKISFMTFMTPEDADEVIAGATAYDGVEPRDRNTSTASSQTCPLRRKEARERFADAGIGIACIATSCTSRRPPRQAPGEYR